MSVSLSLIQPAVPFVPFRISIGIIAFGIRPSALGPPAVNGLRMSVQLLKSTHPVTDLALVIGIVGGPSSSTPSR